MPRMRFRPSKEKAVLSMIGGFIMVGIGIFWAIPTFGTFGIFWTLMALAIGGYHAYLAFAGKGHESEIHFDGWNAFQNKSAGQNSQPFFQNNDVEIRLSKLESLKIKGLISEAEYREKREQILNDL